jgi:hypothetical protein
VACFTVRCSIPQGYKKGNFLISFFSLFKKKLIKITYNKLEINQLKNNQSSKVEWGPGTRVAVTKGGRGSERCHTFTRLLLLLLLLLLVVQVLPVRLLQ